MLTELDAVDDALDVTEEVAVDVPVENSQLNNSFSMVDARI